MSIKFYMSAYFQIFFRVFKRWQNDRLSYAASALTFTTLLALVPLLTVSIAVVSVLPISEAASQEIQELIFQNFIPASGELIQHYLLEFINKSGHLSLIGMGMLIITAGMLLLMIEDIFNQIWKIDRSRRGWPAVLHYAALLSLAPILITLGIAAVSYLISLPFLSHNFIFIGAKKIGLIALPLIITFVLFLLLYLIIPNGKVPFKPAIISAFIATLLFHWVKKIFIIYLLHFQTYSFVYGSLAVLPIFLLWLYLLWSVILFGALLSQIFTQNN